MLRDPAAVRQLRRELDPPAPAAAPPVTSTLGPDEVAADPTRRSLLIARLRDVDKALDNLTDAVGLSWMGFVLLCCSIVPGAGASVWALCDKALNADRVASAVAGIVGGAVVLALVLWGMAEVRRYFRRRAAGVIGRFAADYPRLVETWGGRGVLESRETVAALIRTYDPNPPRPGFFRRLFGG